MSFRRLLKSPGALSELGSQSRGLYKILLGPVEDDLKQTNATTLMLATHGELRYLPFAALHEGEGYLVAPAKFKSSQNGCRFQPNPFLAGGKPHTGN